MLRLVCEKDKCVACGACLNICPKGCISFKINEYDVISAYKNTEQCCKCNLCNIVCPEKKNVPGYIPNTCYAAWSLDNIIRYNSASGGIATELYSYAIDKNYWIAGVKMNADHEAIYSLTKKKCFDFQNSKYTFSNMGSIYLNIADKLHNKEKVLFVGLPCQIAGLRLFLKAKNIKETDIYLVDLICHGTTPSEYLKQHIKKIEEKINRFNTDVEFRNPKYGTSKFYFTLSQNKQILYKKNVNQDDEFQIAYHKGIAYRENCYTCKWANKKRMGDVTLSDFRGLGTQKKCKYSYKNVSCVMINTPKGKKLYRELLQNNRINSVKRPLEENFNTQITLNNPTPKPKERMMFLEIYRETKDFDCAVQIAAKKRILLNRLNTITRYRDIKLFLLQLIPKQFKGKIKHIIFK